MNYKIFILEDDREIRQMVTEYLDSEGFLVDAFSDGSSALKAFSSKAEYDLGLIDLMLPDLSGMDIIKEIRKSSTIPLIILTAKDGDADKSMGLNLGADDYVVKPFSLIELTARIRANIRRASKYGRPPKNDRIKLRNLEINSTNHTASISGRNLELTPTEFELLSVLASHPGQSFSKERLYSLIWREPYFGNENVLNTHINRLRGKLRAASDDDAPYIKTLWGIGYKMEGD